MPSQSKALLGGGRILLLTAAYHLPRAVGLFEKQGFVVTPVACGYESQHTPAQALGAKAPPSISSPPREPCSSRPRPLTRLQECSYWISPESYKASTDDCWQAVEKSFQQSRNTKLLCVTGRIRSTPTGCSNGDFLTRQPWRAKTRLARRRASSQVHDALNTARHACEHHRNGEAAVSCRRSRRTLSTSC